MKLCAKCETEKAQYTYYKGTLLCIPCLKKYLDYYNSGLTGLGGQVENIDEWMVKKK